MRMSIRTGLVAVALVLAGTLAARSLADESSQASTTAPATMPSSAPAAIRILIDQGTPQTLLESLVAAKMVGNDYAIMQCTLPEYRDAMKASLEFFRRQSARQDALVQAMRQKFGDAAADELLAGEGCLPILQYVDRLVLATMAVKGGKIDWTNTVEVVADANTGRYVLHLTARKPIWWGIKKIDNDWFIYPGPFTSDADPKELEEMFRRVEQQFASAADIYPKLTAGVLSGEITKDNIQDKCAAALKAMKPATQAASRPK